MIRHLSPTDNGVRPEDNVTRQDGGPAIFARALGALACSGAVALWLVFLFANPHGQGGRTAGTFFVAGTMIALAAAGAAASIAGEPLWMGVVAAVSFCPVGFYVLLTPSVFLWIGVCNLLLLVTAVFLHRARRHPRPPFRDSSSHPNR